MMVNISGLSLGVRTLINKCPGWSETPSRKAEEDALAGWSADRKLAKNGLRGVNG
jgi:hypothetical protein